MALPCSNVGKKNRRLPNSKKKNKKKDMYGVAKKSNDTAVRDISSLQRKGFVKKAGIGKSTYYYLA